MPNTDESRFSLLEIDGVDAPAARPAPAPAPEPRIMPPNMDDRIAAILEAGTVSGGTDAPTRAALAAALGLRSTATLADCARALSTRHGQPPQPRAASPAPGALPTTAPADVQHIANATRPVQPSAPSSTTQARTVERVTSGGVVAVAAADDTTGAVVYWRLAGDVQIAKLRAAWAAQGRRAETCAQPASPEVALRRAVQELQARDVMIRKHPSGGWGVVYESTAGGSLAYTVGARIYATDDGIAVEPGEGKTQADAEKLAARVRAAYATHRETLTTQDMSAWLVQLVGRLHAVALRDSGGIYFIPRDGVKAYRVVKAALAACSSHVMHEIPALKSSEAIAAILDAISTEVQTEINTLDGALNLNEIGPRAAVNRREHLSALAAKVSSYEKLLGRPLGDALAKIAAMSDRLSKVTTRFANVEIG